MFRSHRTSTPFLLLLTIAALAPMAAPGRDASAATGPALTITAGADQHAISPLIYGMNFADAALAHELRLPIDRWGGNSTTRYNWKLDVHNSGSDYYFENIPDGDSTTLPNDSAADRFIEQDRGTSTQTLLTIPLIGWTPSARKEKHPYDCGFKVTTYGTQQSTDSEWDPDCGNGLHPNGTPISGNQPTDTSVAITPVFVQDWVRHLIARYGTAAQGGVKFYNLDNEPGLWNETHRDVHPAPPTYDELTDRGKQYAAAIKAVDPGALTLGPVQDGWTRYFYSSYDIPQDRAAHGGKPFVVSYLQQMAAYENTNHTRLLDYFDLHYYPQASGVSLSPAGNAATQALRLRSTRALWDASYIDESWIKGTETGNTSVQLIPRMRDWVAKNYPGTKLAISEYNSTSAGSLTSQIGLAGFTSSGTAQVYRYSAANAQQIVKQADQAVGGSFSATFPANSITLMVLPKLSVPLTPRVVLPFARR